MAVLCVAAFFLFLLAGPASALAVSADEQSLQDELAAVKADTSLAEADRNRQTTQINLALDWFQRARQLREQAERDAQEITGAPAERRRLERQIEQLRVQPASVSALLREADADRLEQARDEVQASISSLQASLNASQTSYTEERSSELTPLIDAAQSQADRAVFAVSEASDSASAPSVAGVAGQMQRAELAYRKAKLDQLRQRLENRPARLALYEARNDLLSMQLSQAEARKAELLDLLNLRRRRGVSEIMAEAQRLVADLSEAPESVRVVAGGNVALTEELTALYRQRIVTGQDQQEVQKAIAGIERKEDSLNRLLELKQLTASAVFGSALRREWDRVGEQIGTETENDEIRGLLTTGRIAMFDLEEGRGNYVMPDITDLRSVAPVSMDPTIDRLLVLRGDLLEKLSAAYAQEVEALSTLMAQRLSLSRHSVRFSELLRSHLFWIPSTEVFSFESVRAAEKTLNWLATSSRWRDVRDAMLSKIRNSPIRVLIFALLLAAVIRSRKGLRERLQTMVPLIGKVRTDKFRLTVKAFIYTLVLAAPGAIALLIAADLTARNVGFTGALSVALVEGALVLLFMEFMLQLVRPGGLAEAHFHWSDKTLQLLRHNNRWLLVLLVFVTIVMTLLNGQASPEISDGLGRIVLIVLCVAMFVAAHRIARADARQREASELPVPPWYRIHPGSLVFRVLPIALAVLSIVGYQYSAGQLLSMLILSLFTVMFAAVCYYTLERAFAIYERRLALSRLTSRRAKAHIRNADRDLAEQAGEAIPDIVENDLIDRQTITNQTRTLLRIIVVSGLLLALFLIWQELLPVGRVLDEFVLWRIRHADATQPDQLITLWDALVAVTVLVASLVAMRNLPGALEVAVLSRLKLEPGTGYAVTTVLKYFIVFAGLITASNLIGADWSRLQWLVAALSVGLGFGLQEIVANFVSGVVILFERPFRLGDTITINNQSGTITRIRTRATTLSDWDRKEIIIPNKTFITGQFINWTLTDSVTRLVIPVGVAYGSDTDEVVRLLTVLANSNPIVMTEPSPAALFVGFGESTLNFELRLFSRSMLDRVMLTHQIHMAINEAFRKAGIQIAFPQRDVHVDFSGPVDVVMRPQGGQERGV